MILKIKKALYNWLDKNLNEVTRDELEILCSELHTYKFYAEGGLEDERVITRTRNEVFADF